MNGILFIEFNPVASNFLKFEMKDWFEMLNSSVNFAFNSLSFRMTAVSVEPLGKWRYFK